MENHSHKHQTSKIGWALLLNGCFTIIELIGGLLTNSVAILSDALHDLGDTISLLVSYYFEKVSQRKPNKVFTYGYKRFSLFAAFINSVVLLIGSFIILSQAVPRILNPEHTNASGMFWLAILGIIFNGIAFWKLKGGKNMNEKTISWHLLEDVLGWVSIFIISIVMMWRDFHILDPILSILITLYILRGVVKNLKQTLMLFLQAAPLDIEEIERKLRSIKHVVAVHDTHAWSQDGEHHVISTHLILRDELSIAEILKIKSLARKLLEKKHIHSTIEIELQKETCTDANCR